MTFWRGPDLYTIDANGEAQAELLFKSELAKQLEDLTHDGRLGLVHSRIEGVPTFLLLELGADEMTVWKENATDARKSPDDQWAAYSSDESGVMEIYVDRFPKTGELFRVSNGAFGRRPVWHREGKEIYYVSATGDLMAVPVDMNATKDLIGQPVKLFRDRFNQSYFDIGPDNQRFLISQKVDPEISSIVLIQNWDALLEERP